MRRAPPRAASAAGAGQTLEANDGARIGAPDLVSVRQLGASDEDDIDYYASATKIWLAQGLLANATVRYTRANQFGSLGFGGDRHDDAKDVTEKLSPRRQDRQEGEGDLKTPNRKTP